MVEGQEQRYLEARGGDHLMCPFECDGCLFQKLRDREPAPGDRSDALLLAYLRRANLGAFWAIEPRTVSAHVREVAASVRVGKELGLPLRSHWPLAFGV